MGIITALANPQRFLGFSGWAAPVLALVAVVLALGGLWLGFAVPDDYQQGATVRIMFIHLPAVFTGMMAMAAWPDRPSSAWCSATPWPMPRPAP